MSGVIDMNELIDWLRVQLDEDERVARSAIVEHEGEASWAIRDNRVLWLAVMDSCDPATMPPGMADHIARHDPGHVLAEIAAKRRIIGNCEEVLNGTGWPRLAQITLRLLTAPYAERDGYRQNWRVGP